MLRAYSFLRNAKALFNEGEYDLAAFNVEQFCQLLLKYKLLMKTGSYPRTYSIVRLAEYLSKAAGGKLDKFTESEIIFLTKLEDAYIGARYLPRK
ncbi:MAG: HEPN domain-containing protein [Candidatus Methanodesulfokora washburnensis]